jgi:hypothetical protein
MKGVAAPLTPGLVAKGEAIPSPAVASGTALSSLEASARTGSQLVAAAASYHKALTVRLDEARYKALKLACIDQRLSAQEIFVVALDAWLAASRQQDGGTDEGGAQ